MARTRAALVLAAAAAVGLAVVSGGSSSDPRTPPALPGLPPPFMTVGALGDGGLGAGLDAYGDIVDLRPSPAGRALISDPLARQRAGTVSADAGIVPRASIGGGPPQPFWRADSVVQRFAPGTNILRTTAGFGGARAWTVCAAHGEELGCLVGGSPGVSVSFRPDPAVRDRVQLGAAARPLLIAARRSDRRWLAGARPLGPGAPPWARALYRRSLLVLRALADRRTGALAAGARDGWAYVWPRDAGAAAIALAASGRRADARRIARFLSRIDLSAAARFEASGRPVPGRPAQGDAYGWAAAAARAARLPSADIARLEARARTAWRDRPDYQEKSPGTYLANALASRAPIPADGTKNPLGLGFSSRRRGVVGGRGLDRELDNPGSGLDSAAAWAVRPFTRPALFPAAHATLARLLARAGPHGIVPSEDWTGTEPWTAPTAWSAWSLAALGDRRRALELLADLRRDETGAGLLPERVSAASGLPLSTTPLAWSHAFAILALRQLWPETRQRESQ